MGCNFNSPQKYSQTVTFDGFMENKFINCGAVDMMDDVC